VYYILECDALQTGRISEFQEECIFSIFMDEEKAKQATSVNFDDITLLHIPECIISNFKLIFIRNKNIYWTDFEICLETLPYRYPYQILWKFVE
jgi:hypothetical protein